MKGFLLWPDDEVLGCFASGQAAPRLAGNPQSEPTGFDPERENASRQGLAWRECRWYAHKGILFMPGGLVSRSLKLEGIIARCKEGIGEGWALASSTVGRDGRWFQIVCCSIK